MFISASEFNEFVYNQWEKDVEDGRTNLTFEEYYLYYVE